MSKERKEYPFEKTFDVEFDESALKTFNDLIKEKGIRHFKLESDLYGILDVVSYEEYEKLQQKVEQLEKENKELKQPQVYIDCENMEERYGRDLYEDYLKEKIEQLENIRKEAIEYIKAHKDERNYYHPDNTFLGMKVFVSGYYDLLDILNKGSDKE